MAKKEEKHALYLVDPETQKIELVHADDVEAKKAAGFLEPTNKKPNGTEYNQEEDFPGQDGAAESAKKMQEIRDQKAADQAAEEQKAADAAKKAAKADDK